MSFSIKTMMIFPAVFTPPGVIKKKKKVAYFAEDVQLLEGKVEPHRVKAALASL